MSDLFLRACRREPVERTPIWIMRQAGRYLPEYRALRERVGFRELYRTPDLAAEVTLQPIRRFDLDAAILFSDILVPAEPMGLRLEFKPAPVLDPPLRSASDIARLQPFEASRDLGFVMEAIRTLRRELAGRVPLIGFAAAPFTLAVYLVEGGASKHFEHIKGLLLAEPRLAHGLLETLAETTLDYAKAQIEAGAQAIQLFDSWAGLLGPADYEEFALRYVRRVLDGLATSGVPRIYFALGSSHLLESIRECGADVVGLDWRMPLDRASSRLEQRFVLQGNLDPCVLLAGPAVIQRRARAVLGDARELPGHIFNLGHGVLPATPVEHVQALVDAVRGGRGGEDPAEGA